MMKNDAGSSLHLTMCSTPILFHISPGLREYSFALTTISPTPRHTIMSKQHLQLFKFIQHFQTSNPLLFVPTNPLSPYQICIRRSVSINEAVLLQSSSLIPKLWICG